MFNVHDLNLHSKLKNIVIPKTVLTIKREKGKFLDFETYMNAQVTVHLYDIFFLNIISKTICKSKNLNKCIILISSF